jgi:hypothetical protein
MCLYKSHVLGWRQSNDGSFEAAADVIPNVFAALAQTDSGRVKFVVSFNGHVLFVVFVLFGHAVCCFCSLWP